MTRTLPLRALGDLCDIFSGGTPSRSNAAFFEGDIPWAKISDLEASSDGCLWDTEEHISTEGLNAIRGKMFPAGTLLFAIYGSIGKMAFASRDVSANQAILGIQIHDTDLLDPRYLYRWLGSNQEKFLFDGQGVAQKNLSAGYVRGMQIPLPPLPEQRRIAAILDKADALRAKRRAALDKLDGLTKALFFEMFGDPSANPKGWRSFSIGDVCEVKGGKRLPKGEEYSPFPTPYRYIRVMDLKNGNVDESALVYLKPEVQARIARYTVSAGDIIITIAGTIGAVAPVPDSLDGVNLTENAAKIVPRRRDIYDPVFLSAMLRTPFVQDQIMSHVGQVTIGKLALFRIEKLQVPIPPLSLQREYAGRAESIEKARSQQTASQSHLDALFASLQHRAFRGEL